MPDVLSDEATQRPRRVAVVVAALLLLVVGGGAALRSTLPAPPLEARVERVSGTALAGDGFAQVRIAVHSPRARSADAATLTVGGATATGRTPGGLEDGTLTLQFEVAPDCSVVAGDLRPGLLELALRDSADERRSARVEVPVDGPLGRLLVSSCAGQP